MAQFNENTDFISDMIVSPDGRQLLVTSGDGTLVVLNTTKGTLEAASDNMDDELLSIAIIKVCANRVFFLFVRCLSSAVFWQFLS